MNVKAEEIKSLKRKLIHGDYALIDQRLGGNSYHIIQRIFDPKYIDNLTLTEKRLKVISMAESIVNERESNLKATQKKYADVG